MQYIIKKVWSNNTVEITDRIKKIKSCDILNADTIVFKCQQELVKTLEIDQPALNEITSRLQSCDILLITYDKLDNNHIIYRLSSEQVEKINDQKLLEDVRTYDLCEVIYNTGGDCILDAPDNAHFVTPSGKHVTRFIRVADSIHSYNALDRISYWVQPFTSQSSAIIIDTWPLASVVLKSINLVGDDIPFDCFKEHIACNRSKAIAVLNKISRRIVSNKPILFLVGISTSLW